MRKSIVQIMAAGRRLTLTPTLFAGRRVGESCPNQTLQSDTVAAIDTHLERQLARLHVPGAALAMVDGDKIVHLRGFGEARPDGEGPTPQTPFAIGSLTKSFTALAVMQLLKTVRSSWTPQFSATCPGSSR